MRLFTGFDNVLAVDVGDHTGARRGRIDLKCRLIITDEDSEQGLISQPEMCNDIFLSCPLLQVFWRWNVNIFVN